jgi:hypothetical protein
MEEGFCPAAEPPRASSLPAFAESFTLGLINEIGGKEMKYRVHRFDIRMTRDQSKLEQFLNSLEGEIVAIIPNVTPVPATYVNFLLIVEKVG